MSQRPLAYHKSYEAAYTGAYGSYTGIYTHAWQKVYNGGYAAYGAGAYTSGVDFSGYIEPWASGAYSGAGGAYGLSLVDYASTYSAVGSFEGINTFSSETTYTKAYTKIWQGLVGFSGTMASYNKHRLQTLYQDHLLIILRYGLRIIPKIIRRDMLNIGKQLTLEHIQLRGHTIKTIVKSTLKIMRKYTQKDTRHHILVIILKAGLKYILEYGHIYGLRTT